jgi:hypothetical protein
MAASLGLGMAPAGASQLKSHADDLFDPRANAAALAMEAFAPPPDALPPTNHFEGRLTLLGEREGLHFSTIEDQYGYARMAGGAAHHLPAFDYSLLQVGNALVPVRRGPIPNADPLSEFVLEPGIVWNEAADKGFTRAAIPFSLEEKNANCLHNGVMTFLFRSDGSISDMDFAIASETCLYFKFDMWGRYAALYTPEHIADAGSIAAAYAREVAARLPTRPLSELAIRYPGVDTKAFGDVDNLTLTGVVVDGINYVGPCDTRLGVYPYCDVLDLPSYSVAKSIFAAVAMMRLKLADPSVTEERIAQYVPECAREGTWSDVTFGNMLDLASGHYNSLINQKDEDAPDIEPFFDALDHKGHIQFACSHYPRKADPGTVWVYHTTDTYALGTALNALLKEKAGPSTDIYRDVVDPVWQALDLSPVIDVARRTYDAVAQPFTGWGLAFHRDDIARIADFLNNGDGRLRGRRMLDRHMLDAALQRIPSERGLTALDQTFRYHDGFWAWNVAQTIHCDHDVWVPFMSGYGGITVALLPNGLSYYYFSDGGTYKWAAAVVQADKIRPLCIH